MVKPFVLADQKLLLPDVENSVEYDKGYSQEQLLNISPNVEV